MHSWGGGYRCGLLRRFVLAGDQLVKDSKDKQGEEDGEMDQYLHLLCAAFCKPDEYDGGYSIGCKDASDKSGVEDEKEFVEHRAESSSEEEGKSNGQCRVVSRFK